MATNKAVSGSAPAVSDAVQSAGASASGVAPGAAATAPKINEGPQLEIVSGRATGPSLDDDISTVLGELAKGGDGGLGLPVDGSDEGGADDGEASGDDDKGGKGDDAGDESGGDAGSDSDDGDEDQGDDAGAAGDKKDDDPDALSDEETEGLAPAVKTRLEKLQQQRDEARRQAAELTEAAEEVATLREEAAANQAKIQFATQFEQLLEKDPLLRTFWESHWYGQRRSPKMADYQNVEGADEAFETVFGLVQSFKEQAAAAAAAAAKGGERETPEQYVDRLRAEESELAKDPVLKALTAEQVGQLYDFIAGQRKPKAGQPRNNYRWSLKEAAAVVHGKLIREIVEKTAAEKAKRRDSDKERLLGLKPKGGGAAAPTRDPETMTLDDEFKAEMQRQAAGT